MVFNRELIDGILLRRYKRFLADIKLNDGSFITAHCPNSGSMKTCKEPGWKVMVSDSNNPDRKLRYTWEIVHNGNCWIGINTNLPNKLAEEAIKNGAIKELQGYEQIRKEVKYGKNSRIDLLLSTGGRLCYVEVKNVTLVEDGYYQFPDAVTERGLKHLQELTAEVKAGHRAIMLYVIQRSDGKRFKPARHIDPKYARGLTEAVSEGVETIAYRADVSPQEIKIVEPVEVLL
ncbi:MAG: DNA/RNA nuclease SfsA [Calditrichaceae bacterium]|nr:DNA/RNA nuclease SfsA [Calditrichaceae bacterium]MBN2710498.1 DNA/RNA nuclease SfsA [Calditrichaceae bacterium]RQV97290.1 MAG: DNA/RNA nuclease SfsA [Calditrichota bacterium]